MEPKEGFLSTEPLTKPGLCYGSRGATGQGRRGRETLPSGPWIHYEAEEGGVHAGKKNLRSNTRMTAVLTPFALA